MKIDYRFKDINNFNNYYTYPFKLRLSDFKISIKYIKKFKKIYNKIYNIYNNLYIFENLFIFLFYIGLEK